MGKVAKGVDGQLELITKTLKSEGGESKFVELTAPRLFTSGIAELRNSAEDLTKLRIAVGNRLWINEAILKSMMLMGLNSKVEKRLQRKIDEVYFQLNNVVAHSETETKSQLESLLEMDAVYKRVFEPIYQIGPSLAAKLIKEIVTIERFPNKECLVAYFGLHVRDGKAPRRAKTAPGQEKRVANWNTNGKTALYLWAEQLMKGKCKRPDDPWVKRLLYYYDQYIAEFEVNGKEGRIKNKKHAFYCAYRQVAKKLPHHIYREWKRVESESGVASADSMKLTA